MSSESIRQPTQRPLSVPTPTAAAPRALLAPGAAAAQASLPHFLPNADITRSDVHLVATQLERHSLLPVLCTAGDPFANTAPFQSPQALVGSLAVVAPLEVEVGRLHVGGPQYLRVPFVDPAQLEQATFTATASGLALSVGLLGEGSVGAATGSGYASISGGGLISTPGGLHAPGATIIAWRNNVGVAGTYTFVDAHTGHLVLAAALVSVSGERDVAYLGTASEAEQSAFLSRGPLLSGLLRHVEIHHRRSHVRHLRLGAGTFKAALLGRIDRQHESDLTYRTFVTEPQARQLLFGENDGRNVFLRRARRGLGWAKEVIPMPDPKSLLNLRPGEEVQFIRAKTWVLGLAVGNVAAWASSQLWLRGDVHFSVKQKSETEVDLVVTPARVRAQNLYAVSPLGAYVGAKVSRAIATRQRFNFDLTFAEARALYTQALAGHPPNPPQAYFRETASWFQTEMAGLQEVTQPEVLPEGVTRHFVHTIEGTLKGGACGIKLLFVPRNLLPTYVQTGIGKSHQHFDETQTFRAHNNAYRTTEAAHVVVSDAGVQGTRSHKASATLLERKRGDVQASMESLRFNLDLSANHAAQTTFYKQQVNQAVARSGIYQGAPAAKTEKQARQLTLTQSLSAPQLTSLLLALSQHDDVLSTGSVRVQAAARLAGVAPQKLFAAVKRAQAQTTPSARAMPLLKFIQTEGMPGVCALLRLSMPAAAVESHEEGDEAGLALYAAQLAEFRFEAPVEETAAPDAVVLRLAALAKVVHQLDRAWMEAGGSFEAANGQSSPLAIALLEAREKLLLRTDVPHVLWEAVDEQLIKKKGKNQRLRFAVGFHTRAFARARELLGDDRGLVRLADLNTSVAPNLLLSRLLNRFNVLENTVKMLEEIQKATESESLLEGILLSPSQASVMHAHATSLREDLVGSADFPDGSWDSIASLKRLSPRQRSEMKKLCAQKPWSRTHRLLNRALDA